MELDTPIRTPRLVLRTLGAVDVNDRYLAWMRDAETTRYLESRLIDHSLASLGSFVEISNTAPDTLLLGVCLIDGRRIGNIKLGPIDGYHRSAPVGLLIGERDQWGKGLATEAIVGLTGHAFTALSLEKLWAGCYASNMASARAFIRAGWVEEGRSKAHWRLDPGRDDNIVLGITRVDWSARPG